MRTCEEGLWRGLAAARLGGRLTDISHAIETHVRSQGDYGIVEDYVGHGIGSAMHMPPNVPNYGRAGRGPKLVEGMALAVEPMITLGTIDTNVLADDWTVVTDDGSWSAHFEHSFTLTPKGALVLTALDGGSARLKELGVPCAADRCRSRRASERCVVSLAESCSKSAEQAVFVVVVVAAGGQ